MENHIISTLVEDKPGVLQKVTGLIRRRGFNIEGITVGDSEKQGFARMIITIKADSEGLEQVIKQLNKLVEIIKINNITENSVKRELCLIKLKILNEKARSEIIQYSDIFKAKILNVREDNLIIELTGSSSKIDAFISLTKSFGIITLTRTGLAAISRD